jgi:hypothetical protein
LLIGILTEVYGIAADSANLGLSQKEVIWRKCTVWRNNRIFLSTEIIDTQLSPVSSADNVHFRNMLTSLCRFKKRCVDESKPTDAHSTIRRVSTQCKQITLKFACLWLLWRHICRILVPMKKRHSVIRVFQKILTIEIAATKERRQGRQALLASRRTFSKPFYSLNEFVLSMSVSCPTNIIIIHARVRVLFKCTNTEMMLFYIRRVSYKFRYRCLVRGRGISLL